jgi:ABC-type transporter Mla MlaB component
MGAALVLCVLRTSILYLRDRTKVVLSGQLVRQWAECLPKVISQYCSAQDIVEIDLDGITCVDHAGEEALLSLQQAHGRFLCASPFARTLCERLGVSVEGDRR